ncbi:MAG: alanine dehydrogenase [Bacillota bacterium]
MIIGVPKEIKDNENRVALTPAGVYELVKSGHRVYVQKGAGVGSGFPDEDYTSVGAGILDKPGDIFEAADMIVKVKEPLEQEYNLLKEGQILFTYLHLAAEPKLVRVLLQKKIIGIAYETVERDGMLPLLIPMSEIAGRMSVQIGAHFLERPWGRGILLGGVPGVKPAGVTIIGGGTVGINAARIALGMGAKVTILEKSESRLRYLDDIFGGRVQTLMSNACNIAEAVEEADLLIGAVLIPGARAPKLVTKEMVQRMRPGSVIVDVAVDQGACVETIDRVTTHSDPVYEAYGVIHYSVANIPGAVARTATLALTNATLPFVINVANKGWLSAVKDDSGLAKGVNVLQGTVTHPAVAESLGLQHSNLVSVLQGVSYS